jgi:hypothetical protein
LSQSIGRYVLKLSSIVYPASYSSFMFAVMKEIILKHWDFQVLAKFTEMTSKYTQEMQAVSSIFLL